MEWGPDAVPPVLADPTSPVRVRAGGLLTGTLLDAPSTLACALAESGSVLLIDADPQGSAVEWVKNAPALPFQAVSAPHLDSLALVPDAERFVGPDQADLEAMIAGMAGAAA